MIQLRFAPITEKDWPGKPTPTWKRRNDVFRAKYSVTLDDLESELQKLGARDIVIQAFFKREDIRNDGWPRSSARPSQPGVILSFINREKQEISFPCDTFCSYEANLRAIAKSLEALRAVDRYGVTKQNEQYKGWAKLPPARDSLPVPEAAVFISLHSEVPADLLNDRVAFERAIRTAQKKLHPDNPHTGNQDQFLLLAKASDVIKQAYGW